MATNNFCRYATLSTFAVSVLFLASCSSNDSDSKHKADTSDVEVSVRALPVSEPVFGMPVSEAESPPLDENRQAYDAVVERIQARGYPSDYALLRKEYLKTDLYDPYDREQREATRAMFEAMDAEDLTRCVKLANTILARNFTSLAAHKGAENCYGKLEDFDQQEVHARIYRGLLGAIAASGDGRTPGSAFVVISVDEIYDFLQARDLEVVKEALGSDHTIGSERKIEVIPVRDPRSGRSFNLYFDISAEQIYFSKKLQR
jgi:hypothetical protein